MKLKSRQVIGKWSLIRCIGKGGNGEVWECVDKDQHVRAIKILKRSNTIAHQRFLDEIQVLINIQELEGILPIEEHSGVSAPSISPPYYVMPVAQTCESILSSQSIEARIEALLDIANVLEKLHELDITHRDIKPQNILYYSSRFVLADFGLADFPLKREVSRHNENIGAKWTIAPEMKRQSSNADKKKADVYSLAKTLWIILTNNEKGFDGQYMTNSINALKSFNRGSFTATIDNLLIRCTDNDPAKRPTITEFIHSLKEWQALTKDFHDRMRREWFEIQTLLFPTSIPERVIWSSTTDILKILKTTCSTENLNHVFFPTSGGLDLIDVKIANEKSCLELDCGVIEIVKPKRLLFESFGDDPEWNYFRLELDKLDPVVFPAQFENSPRRMTDEYEDVAELAPGMYFPYFSLSSERDDFLVNNYGRWVRRRFRGNFVIFGKRSTYNLTPDTYDGRHDQMDADSFRKLILTVIKKISAENEKAAQQTNAPDNPEVVVPKFFLEEQDVYRCRHCGRIVDKEGNDLSSHDRDYCWALLRRFGDKQTIPVTGKCGKHSNARGMQ